ACFNSLVFLGQGLGEVRMSQLHERQGQQQDLWVISNNLYAVTGLEHLQPWKATVLGPCKVIPLEYPGVTCRSIDIPVPPKGSRESEILNKQLLAEVLTRRSDQCVAYRGSHRWVQAFEPVLLSESDSPTRLREHGVYL